MQSSLQARTASLNRDVRSALANEIENSLGFNRDNFTENGGGNEESSSTAIHDENHIVSSINFDAATHPEEANRAIAELDVILSECSASLVKIERAERLVYVRVNAYRKMLNDQSERLSLQNDNSDLTTAGHDAESDETKEEKDRRQISQEREKEKIHQNIQSLSKVEEIHRTMVENVARMRLRIVTLERKREEIILARDECREFLVAAAQAEEYEMAGQVDGKYEEEKDETFEDDLEAGSGESELVGVEKSLPNVHNSADAK
mmetsp:Transcript_12909/g.17293  ORF Transcript_12909/g.17293 Transcript_12909/m.17293 type:complete len:263 (+) Transcript_12909:46-834(+)